MQKEFCEGVFDLPGLLKLLNMLPANFGSRCKDERFGPAVRNAFEEAPTEGSRDGCADSDRPG